MAPGLAGASLFSNTTTSREGWLSLLASFSLDSFWWAAYNGVDRRPRWSITGPRGSGAVVACHLAKVKVAGPNPVFRSLAAGLFGVTRKSPLQCYNL